jgi:polyferredoxin
MKYNNKKQKKVIKHLSFIFFGGILILVGVVMVNTQLKMLSAFLIGIGAILFLLGLLNLD